MEVKVSIGYTVPLGVNTTSHIRAGLEATVETSQPIPAQMKEIKKVADATMEKLSTWVDEFITKKQNEFEAQAGEPVGAIPVQTLQGPAFDLTIGPLGPPAVTAENDEPPAQPTPPTPVFDPSQWGFGPGSGFIK